MIFCLHCFIIDVACHVYRVFCNKKVTSRVISMGMQFIKIYQVLQVPQVTMTRAKTYIRSFFSKGLKQKLALDGVG